MFSAPDVRSSGKSTSIYNLTSYAFSLATGASLASDKYWPWPVIATAIWILLFIVAAVARFDRIEL